MDPIPQANRLAQPHPWLLVAQPNGLLAAFCWKLKAFTHLHLTDDLALALARGFGWPASEVDQQIKDARVNPTQDWQDAIAYLTESQGHAEALAVRAVCGEPGIVHPPE